MELKRFYTTEKLSEHIAETPEGFLLCSDVPITRIGVFEYKDSEVPIKGNKDGLVKIQRDEDEVFAETTIKSFEGKPITINHPDDFVTPENWNELAHGHLQNVKRGEGEQKDLLLADLLITTQKAIELVKSGLREVSCGYDAKYTELQEGLGKQTNIIGNHVALVIKGRAGGRCAIQDNHTCNGCGECSCKKNNLGQEENNVMKKKMKGVRDGLKSLFPKFLDSIKDEDLEEAVSEEKSDVEIAEQAAEEAKAAAEQAVNAAKEAAAAVETLKEEPAKEQPVVEEEQPQMDDEVAGDPLVAINARLDKLEALIQELIDYSEEGTEEEEQPEEESTEVEEEPISDEDVQETVSKAGIIDPDTDLEEEKLKTKDSLANLKKKTLKKALTGDNASAVKSLLKGKTVDSLPVATLDAIFDASAEMIVQIRSKKLQKDSFMSVRDFGRMSAKSVADINAKNKAFWNNKK
jgi:uncharacterized protein